MQTISEESTLPDSTKINGVEVTFDRLSDASLLAPSGTHLGEASHTVSTSDLRSGLSNGLWDGFTFRINGEALRLGVHSYEDSDGETTCTAAVYVD
jgi:hypothetical protein